MKGIIFYSLLLSSIPVFAQVSKVKYGDIKPEDFAPSAYAVDSSASGVVLFDIGSSDYEGDTYGGFSIIYKRHTRIRLLNRNSFDLASITIPLYASGSLEERIESLEATTYNLEDGKVQVYKLDKNTIFKDRLNKNYTVRKFTLPNLKEGSIIEIKYSLNSPYERDLRPWYFQGHNPVLLSDYAVTIPSIYDFVTLPQGYIPFTVHETTTGNQTYVIRTGGNTSERGETFNFPTTTVTQHWTMKSIPAIKKEEFTTTIDNHISKIDFQLSKIRYPNSPVRDIMSDWYTMSKELMKSPSFGEALTKNNGWLRDELKTITAGANTPFDKARKIFEFVRDNMSCTNSSAVNLSNPIKKVFQTKSGNVADINLLLTALLINSGFDAKPVLLSTRDHGKAFEIYPIIDKLNYVITKVMIDDQSYLLDASQTRLGFGKLSQECYNGYARIIDENSPVLIDLCADSVKENKLTTVFIVNDEKGGLTGRYSSTFGQFESQNLRDKLVKKSKEDYFKELRKGYSFDINFTNTNIDSLKNYEEPIVVNYDFKFDTNEDIIYLTPVFGEEYKENPFKAEERSYPVEMPSTIAETYIFKMDIPKGYAVEEIPKSSRVKLNEDEGLFEYLVDNKDGSIQLRSTVRLNKASFLPEDYGSLRDFYGYIVKKNSEQIVLKKIK